MRDYPEVAGSRAADVRCADFSPALGAEDFDAADGFDPIEESRLRLIPSAGLRAMYSPSSSEPDPPTGSMSLSSSSKEPTLAEEARLLCRVGFGATLRVESPAAVLATAA